MPVGYLLASSARFLSHMACLHFVQLYYLRSLAEITVRPVEDPSGSYGERDALEEVGHEKIADQLVGRELGALGLAFGHCLEESDDIGRILQHFGDRCLALHQHSGRV